MASQSKFINLSKLVRISISSGILRNHDGKYLNSTEWKQYPVNGFSENPFSSFASKIVKNSRMLS